MARSRFKAGHSPALGGLEQAAAARSIIPFDGPVEARYSIGMPNREQAKADVMQGTLDLMVLQTLSALGPLHGYAIAARLEQVSGGALQLNMGTLYPALMRLEQRGLLRGKWGTTDNNRKARFYALSAAGRRELAREKQAWDRMAAIMHALLRGA
jgi:transcriptional regulator